MSPMRIGSTPIEFTVEGINISLSNLSIDQYLAPKNLNDLKFFQELSAADKHEEVMNYITFNAASISVSR